MSATHESTRRADEAGPTSAAATESPGAVYIHARPPSVVAIIVTWNRKGDLDGALKAVARQDYPLDQLGVIVIDNASEDGTSDFIESEWAPDVVVDNPTPHAHKPEFQIEHRRPEDSPPRNAGGLASLTLIRNRLNHGGCGGFNTGLRYIGDILDANGDGPDYAWLVDDDIDLPPDALRRLTEAAEGDPEIGLVGSRTCDINNRDTTIETTIYLDRNTGLLADEPGEGHPLKDSHDEWATKVGGPKGQGPHKGLREVDVVSACSMLARWSAVREIGYWDPRYFIYCDDADWCLRFARSGRRVVLNLDAVVYHTPWHLKLTPARLYYAQRNLIWMLHKSAPEGMVKRLVFRRMAGVLKSSLIAAIHRRLWHAEIMRRSVDDVLRDLGGKLDFGGPSPKPVHEALKRAGAARPGGHIIAICPTATAEAAAEELAGSQDQNPDGAGPRWTLMVRNDVPDAHTKEPQPGTRRVIYGHRWRSKLRRQLPLLGSRIDAVLVFDNDCDVPLLRGRWNLHAESQNPETVRAEPGGLRARAGFLCRWTWTAARTVLRTLRLRRDTLNRHPAQASQQSTGAG